MSSFKTREQTNARNSCPIQGMAASLFHDKTPEAVALRIANLVAAECGTDKGAQTLFCKQAKVGRNTLNQWIKKCQGPRLDMAIKLCERFDLTLDWIYRGIPTNLPEPVKAKLFSSVAKDPPVDEQRPFLQTGAGRQHSG